MGKHYFKTPVYENAKDILDKAKARGFECSLYSTSYGHAYEVSVTGASNSDIAEMVKGTVFER